MLNPTLDARKSGEELPVVQCFHSFPSVLPRVLCAANPDLVQLKSLLAGLTLPVKKSAEVAPEEQDGEFHEFLHKYELLCGENHELAGH